MIPKVPEAVKAFSDGNYDLALAIYRQLASELGGSLFAANISLCERRLKESSCASTKSISASQSSGGNPKSTVCASVPDQYPELPNYVELRQSAEAKFALSENPIWFELPLTEADFVQILIDVRFVGIPTTEAKKALLLLDCLDTFGNSLSGPYPGFTHSDTVGWFKYLNQKQSETENIVDVRVCQGTKRVRLGLRSFKTQGQEQVLIRNRLELIWHDNQKQVKVGERRSGAPLLPCLPFELPKGSASRKPRVASILDPFSHACFEPECDLIPVTPSGWRHELIGKQIDFVLVESSWHGNEDSWLYRVASYNKPPGDELRDIICWARKFGVPTVFWNKEDPPNFDRFIDRAADFDYIFTTDENCIERYRKRVGPGRTIAALPFAAQTKIHNPILNQPRLDATSFAGTYYADDFEPRRRAMDMLLRVSARFGLDIFDRMHGVSGKDKERFEFPSDLQPHIRGSLTYREILEAYRHYRVALNVNSVSDSPTMFSRRVFELLACGTPVVSTESLGIDRIFKGLVPTVETEDEAVQCIERLMTNPGEWLRTSVKGTRAVFSEHTYGHRVATIARAIGLSSFRSPERSVVALVRPTGDPLRLVQMLSQQKVTPSAIVVIGSLGADEKVKHWVDSLNRCGAPVVTIPFANVPSYLCNRHPDSVAAFLDGSRYYGPAYLLDTRISLEGAVVSDASGISMKHAQYANPDHLTFNDVRTIGMPIEDVDIASLAMSAVNPCLVEAISSFVFGSAPKKIIVRSRAPFDFLPSFADNSAVRAVRLF